MRELINFNLSPLEITLNRRWRNFSIMGETSSGFVFEGLSLEHNEPRGVLEWP